MRWDKISGTFRFYEKGGGGSSTTTTQNFSPEEAAERKKVQEEAARIYSTQAGSTPPTYPGALPTPFSPNTASSRDMAAKYAVTGATDLANSATGYSQFAMGPAQYAEANPYLQSSINAAVRPITEAYSGAGGALSQIRGGAQQAGQYGSSRQGVAEGLAAQGYQQAVGDTAANMANQNYQQAQETALRAMALGPQTQQMGLMPAGVFGQLGAQEEALQQEVEQYFANRRQWDQNAPWTPLQNYANIVYGGGSGGGTATSNFTAPQPNRAVGAIGGAASGAAMGTMIMPGWGTAIGAGVGLLAGLFSG